ncbi:MAG: heparan-alpha-glucosaminide N-acetyltransferase [Candidatus Thermoplasmatota archaeon]|nr:heparan-alpha-glucosaminide N-acetyltransferase [Candidatus Thermoplasmatota archaeon]
MRVRQRKTDRFIELDVLRGFAIIGMIFLHIIWDLDYYGVCPLNRELYRFQFIIPSMFLLLVGICLSVNYVKNKEGSGKKLWFRLLKRGAWIFALGVLLTIVSLVIAPERPIVFGILHCIGLGIILSIIFLRLRTYNILIGMAVVMFYLLSGNVFVVENPSLFQLVLGFHQSNVFEYTIDYFPIMPWFGVSLIGTGLGNIFYDGGNRKFGVPKFLKNSEYKIIKILSIAGQKPLIIYLVHQPVITGLLFLCLNGPAYIASILALLGF